MVPTGEPGVYRSTEPVPVTGEWKTMLRLHRGAAMVAAPIYMPADPEIDAPKIAAVDREAPFQTEQRFLLREQNGESGPAWFAFADLPRARSPSRRRGSWRWWRPDGRSRGTSAECARSSG